MQKAVQSGLPFVVQKMKIWRFIMADERTEKQKVQEITDKLEEGLRWSSIFVTFTLKKSLIGISLFKRCHVSI